MNKFPKVHIWMLLPLVIAVAGFYFSYWSKFSSVPFHQHLHGLTALAWYCLLVIQPWLIIKKNNKLHRNIGFIGLIIAGGLIFSALQIIPYNLTNERLELVLRYGLSWGDFIFLIGFTHAVIMAMLNNRNIDIHARYMISAAIWALLPALSRLLYFPLIITYGYPPPLSFIEVIQISSVMVVITLCVMSMIDYRNQKKIYTSYILVALGTILFAVTLEPMGSNNAWIEFCKKLL